MRLHGFGFGSRQSDTPAEDARVLLMVVVGWVYMWDSRRVVRLGGNGRANALCVHQEDLYEGEPAGVIAWSRADFLPLKGNRYTVAICSICSGNGRLFHSIVDNYSVGLPNKVYDTLAGEVIAEREGIVSSLCFHAGKLYDGGALGVYETLTNKHVSERSPINALCSNNGILYDAGDNGIYETLTGDNVVSPRWRSLAMCSHLGRLCDARESDGVYDTLGNRKILDYNHIKHAGVLRSIMGRPFLLGRSRISAIHSLVSAKYSIVKRLEPNLEQYQIAMCQ